MIDQPADYSFLHWLYTNALPAWLAFLVSFSVNIWNFTLRKRPKRLVVQEGVSIPYLLGPNVRDPRLDVLWDGQLVKDPRVIRYMIVNEGSETISKPEFILTLPSETRVLEALIGLVGSGSRSNAYMGECDSSRNNVTVSLPYANAFREHEEAYSLLVLTDGETSPTEVKGSGEGWSVRYLPLQEQMRRSLKRLYAIFGIGAVSGIFSISVVARFASKYPHTLGTRVLLVMVMVFVGIGSVFMTKFMMQTIRRDWIENNPRVRTSKIKSPTS